MLTTMLSTDDRITTAHRAKLACVYVRQSVNQHPSGTPGEKRAKSLILPALSHMTRVPIGADRDPTLNEVPQFTSRRCSPVGAGSPWVLIHSSAQIASHTPPRWNLRKML